MAEEKTNGVAQESSDNFEYDCYLRRVEVKDAPLDKNLMRMDQEFNDSFEKRMSRNINLPDLQLVQDGDDLHKTITIFRKVAQEMGDEWKPVFQELMKSQKPEVFDQELKAIEEHKPLIRGYRALMVWKELSGSTFHISKLIDALRSAKMDEIAQEVLFMTNGWLYSSLLYLYVVLKFVVHIVVVVLYLSTCFGCTCFC